MCQPSSICSPGAWSGGRVVGWSMSAAMTAQLVTDALVMAIWRRGKPDALLHQSADEPLKQRLGQCGDGELLLVTEDRAHSTQTVPNER
jgi:putative transposase